VRKRDRCREECDVIAQQDVNAIHFVEEVAEPFAEWFSVGMNCSSVKDWNGCKCVTNNR
jgi:hypothetical protein